MHNWSFRRSPSQAFNPDNVYPTPSLRVCSADEVVDFGQCTELDEDHMSGQDWSLWLKTDMNHPVGLEVILMVLGLRDDGVCC